MNTLITLIVPVYNVEPYIEECLTSLVQQTYPHLQIVIVNDGSKDKSRKIAAFFQKEDARITIVDKENGGLSDARNAGMALIKGEYTAFVDSDDVLARDWVEKSLRAALLNRADIVQTNHVYMWPDKMLIDSRTQHHTLPFLLEREDAMKALIDNVYLKNFAWGKLYRSELIKDKPFPVGKLFEDMFWQHLVFHDATLVAYVQEALYGYRQREGSIIAAYSVKHLDILDGILDRCRFMKLYYPKLYEKQREEAVHMHLVHYKLLARKPFNKQWQQARRRIKREMVQGLLMQPVLSREEMIKQHRLFLKSPLLYIGREGIEKGRRAAGLTQAVSPLRPVTGEAGLI
ncbi:glycosyltransferase family 2 protein [Alkalicoccus luteus]|uniref:glycosyltransferase family 2 protein n=1 Tax=Alkalicoccus luteus TaxID=1237094 RepID=UPI0040347F2D